MSTRTAQHATFIIERAYDFPPASVFAAWAEPKAKAAWFAGLAGKWKLLNREMDFRVGGRERLKGAFTGGPVSEFQAHYHDIVTNQRIVYSYRMQLDEKLISVSLATVEFQPAAGGATKLVVTEQGAFLDGYDDAGSREQGTGALLANLEKFLATA